MKIYSIIYLVNSSRWLYWFSSEICEESIDLYKKVKARVSFKDPQGLGLKGEPQESRVFLIVWKDIEKKQTYKEKYDFSIGSPIKMTLTFESIEPVQPDRMIFCGEISICFQWIHSLLEV